MNWRPLLPTFSNNRLTKMKSIRNGLQSEKGDRSLACNYRLVSLTCVPGKLLEHIVCSNIIAHLDEHRLLSDKQHAFSKWHSCETLTTMIDDWAKSYITKVRLTPLKKALTLPS